MILMTGRRKTLKLRVPPTTCSQGLSLESSEKWMLSCTRFPLFLKGPICQKSSQILRCFWVRGQIVNVHEEVVRDLHSGETVSGQNADSGVEAIKSKLTTASPTSKE